eukprot:TRINITY_DN13562_c0_g1_i4.p1 TRINITY_DN13562_c0_g1~~TRINITY_DN13562_c0_g1_i4.p1  ORF type:complete len:354 (-),score=65.86 TRINITY_DN13562_c0_g1_i4:57-1118(-)
MGCCAGNLAFGARQKQRRLGPQSRRGDPDRGPMSLLQDNEHALKVFQVFLENERRFCADFAVFYHSYSHAAVLYEVRAALAAEAKAAPPSLPMPPLPRLMLDDFAGTPDAQELMRKVETLWGPERSDHRAEFRRVGISAMCSLLAVGPECCMQVAFLNGYSCKGVAFRHVLEDELHRSLREVRRRRRSPSRAPGPVAEEGDDANEEEQEKEEVARLADDLIALARRYGLDTTLFGDEGEFKGLSGHILQIFVRRDLVDPLCYPALPYGAVDRERLPISRWLSGNRSFSWGQARILAHPTFFTDAAAVKLCVGSADAGFQTKRAELQRALRQRLARALRFCPARESHCGLTSSR